MKQREIYIAFLRGINVGGHHKVPMKLLCTELEKLNLTQIRTVLNSGNVIFESKFSELNDLEHKISAHLEGAFGFSIPVILRKATNVEALIQLNPFRDIELTKDLRFYVSLLPKKPGNQLQLPFVNDDKSFSIIKVIDKTIISVLDISVNKTPKAMEALERYYGKDITTRNWNTMIRIYSKLI